MPNEKLDDRVHLCIGTQHSFLFLKSSKKQTIKITNFYLSPCQCYVHETDGTGTSSCLDLGDDYDSKHGGHSIVHVGRPRDVWRKETSFLSEKRLAGKPNPNPNPTPGTKTRLASGTEYPDLLYQLHILYCLTVVFKNNACNHIESLNH